MKKNKVAADKKKVQHENKKLSASQYWEFRSTIYEREIVDKNVETEKLRVEVTKLKLQVLQHELAKVSGSLVQTQERRKEVAKEYDDFLNNLEKEVGTKIKGKVINPYTFEITDETHINV